MTFKGLLATLQDFSRHNRLCTDMRSRTVLLSEFSCGRFE